MKTISFKSETRKDTAGKCPKTHVFLKRQACKTKVMHAKFISSLYLVEHNIAQKWLLSPSFGFQLLNGGKRQVQNKLNT